MATITHRVTTTNGIDLIRAKCPTSFLQAVMYQYTRTGTVQFCDAAGQVHIILTFDML